MKVFLLFLSMLFASVAFGNPRVTKNTDIGKRKVESHHQVTRCDQDGCQIDSVTTFNKKIPGKHHYYGECNYAEEGGKRYSHCELSSKKKKPKVKVKTVTKIKKKTAKKNRLQIHVGYGSDGLRHNSNNNETEVKENRTVILGGQYTRALKGDVNVGFSVFSNKSATVTLGFDY